MRLILKLLCLLWLLGSVHGRHLIAGDTFVFPTDDPESVVFETGDQTIDAAWQRYLRWCQETGSRNEAATSSASNHREANHWDADHWDAATWTFRPTRRPTVGSRLGSVRWHNLRTPVLDIVTTADEAAAVGIAAQLHQTFDVWTQLFFPLWDQSSRIAEISDGDLDPNRGDASQTGSGDAALRRFIPRRRRLKVLLLRDQAEYAKVLSPVAGSQQSAGYYDHRQRLSFLFVGDDWASRRSRTHEAVHQFFAEATTGSSRRGTLASTESTPWFWLLEGIAGYMESATPIDRGRTVVGGWTSSRLQYARHRLAGGENPMPLSMLGSMNRSSGQRQTDLPRFYNDATAWTHFCMAEDDRRRWLYQQLQSVYGDRRPATTTPSASIDDLRSFVRNDDGDWQTDAVRRPLTELCLAGCTFDATTILDQLRVENLHWIDLSGCPVNDADIAELAASARHATEWDLTQTMVGDKTVAAIPAVSAEVIYLTATRITDDSIGLLAEMPKLKTLDVQATAITDSAAQELRDRRPDIELNPLQIIQR